MIIRKSYGQNGQSSLLTRTAAILDFSFELLMCTVLTTMYPGYFCYLGAIGTETSANFVFQMFCSFFMMSQSSVKLTTFQNWKKSSKYLQIDSARKILTCDICIKWKARLSGTNAFISGSSNFKSSAVSEHVQSKLHKQALRFEEEEQAAAENRKARVHRPPAPSDAPIVQGIVNIGQLTPDERSAMQNLFDIAYLLAYKGRPYSDFTDLVDIEKLHGVKFMLGNVYENDMGCKLFIHFAAKALYEREVKEKVKTANFVTVM